MISSSTYVHRLCGAPAVDGCTPIAHATCWHCASTMDRGMPVLEWMGANFVGQNRVRAAHSHHICESCVFFAPIRTYVCRTSRNGVMLGLRRDESKSRRIVWATRGECYAVRDGSLRCLPIGDWTGMDVFALIVSTGVPYFHVYDNDSHCMPHEQRTAWMLNPRFISRGAATFLRAHYAAQFWQLCDINPALRRFT